MFGASRRLPQLVCLTVLGLLMTLKQGESATINAASVALGDVTAAISAAANGDTVIIPPGQASWTTSLTVTKNITIQGATTVTGPRGSYAVSDNTVILYDIPSTAGTGAQQAIFNVVLNLNSPFRITGITFKKGSVTSPGANILRFSGTCSSVRVDHCHFYHPGPPSPYTIEWQGWLYGVIDHNKMEMAGDPLDIGHQTWNVGGYSPAPAWGDGSWADPPFFSSEKFCFIEDNELINIKAGVANGACDGENGQRVVARYNYVQDYLDFQDHGTESSGRMRSGREMLIYGNTYNYQTIAPSGSLIRGGTGLWYNNTFSGPLVTEAFNGKAVRYFRQDHAYATFGGTDGSNPWDNNNSADHTGNGYGGGPNGRYASGVHSGSNGATTLTVKVGSPGNPAPGWTVNQWVGYTVRNNTTTNSTNFAPILSNTANTITYMKDEYSASYIRFNSGDSFSIYKVISGIDQVGAGRGDLLTGNAASPINTRTGTVAYPNQTLEPWYGWNNKIQTVAGASLEAPMVTNCYFVQENHHYYPFNSSWTPGDALSKGVAMGTMADRPASCTQGVAYWATDQGANGTLYQCSSPDTWTQYYQPYAYPHPLISGVPTAPTNLKVVVQ